MSNQFVGEVRMVSVGFAPRGLALCNGQLLAIVQNQALFSLLGTTYGGNGIQTFALPDLRSRTPLHFGSGGGGSYSQGQAGGEENHTLTVNEVPTHVHGATASGSAPDVSSPAGASWATPTISTYGTAPNATMNSASAGNSGGGQAHPNMPPFLVINFSIALQGIFPSRN